MTKINVKNNGRKIISGIFLLVFSLSLNMLYAQSDWKVDDAHAKLKNPVPATDASIKDGKALFMTNCKSCHGDPGKNNGLPLVPHPTDLANPDFLSTNSDGAIFTKVTDGRIAMPTFKAVLSETQRWNVVNYIRSLDKNKKAVAAVPASAHNDKPKGTVVGAPYKLNLVYEPENNKLLAVVQGTTADGELAPASGVEVGFFIKRYFGDLPVSDPGLVTDENGQVSASVPVDLPGGEEGKALALAKVADVDTYGAVSAETEVNVKSIEIVNLLDHRSLWTVRVMAPWWLIFTYFGLVIGVWGTLGYVVMQLFKLKKAGN